MTVKPKFIKQVAEFPFWAWRFFQHAGALKEKISFDSKGVWKNLNVVTKRVKLNLSIFINPSNLGLATWVMPIHGGSENLSLETLFSENRRGIDRTSGSAVRGTMIMFTICWLPTATITIQTMRTTMMVFASLSPQYVPSEEKSLSQNFWFLTIRKCAWDVQINHPGPRLVPWVQR